MALGTPNKNPSDLVSDSVFAKAQDTQSFSVYKPFFAADYYNGQLIGDNVYRPFYTAPIEHDPMTSTIILVQANAPESSNADVQDYMFNFNTFLSSIDRTGESVVVNGSIPVLPKVGNNFYGIFKNFSIINFNESRAELSKVNLNFGLKWNAYFFGAQPRMYSYSGAFLDAKNYPYYEQFMRAYDNYLAGGKCVENGFKMYMAYDNKIITGWMLGINIVGSSDQRFTKQFSFQILVDSENFYRWNDYYDAYYQYQGQSREMSNEYVLRNSL